MQVSASTVVMTATLNCPFYCCPKCPLTVFQLSITVVFQLSFNCRPNCHLYRSTVLGTCFNCSLTVYQVTLSCPPTVAMIARSQLLMGRGMDV